MKEFRIAKCLTDNGIQKFVIFTDGSRKLIRTNDIGEYFRVDNELNPDYEFSDRYGFTGRVKDAVTTIKKGDGDCIIQRKNMFGIIDYVIYFIDRSIGDKYRQTFIEGWKDCKFKYGNTIW